jgi:hypothetical protein
VMPEDFHARYSCRGRGSTACMQSRASRRSSSSVKGRSV